MIQEQRRRLAIALAIVPGASSVAPFAALAQPAAVERPNVVRMVLNLKTSRALGIAIPPSIRHRADELID